MDKEEELLETLEKIKLGDEALMPILKEDFIKLIKSKLERGEWNKTFEFVRNRKIEFEGRINPLTRKMFHLYNIAYQKMWSLNKNDE